MADRELKRDATHEAVGASVNDTEDRSGEYDLGYRVPLDGRVLVSDLKDPPPFPSMSVGRENSDQLLRCPIGIGGAWQRNSHGRQGSRNGHRARTLLGACDGVRPARGQQFDRVRRHVAIILRPALRAVPAER